MKKYIGIAIPIIPLILIFAVLLNHPMTSEELSEYFAENLAHISYLVDDPIHLGASTREDGYDNTYNIYIELNYADGSNIPIAAKELTSLIYELAEPQEIEINSITFEEVEPDTSNSISWYTSDGINGLYSNDTVEPKVSKPNILLEELTSPDITVDIEKNIEIYLRQHVKSSEYLATSSKSIIIDTIGDELYVSVRTISSGGFYIPIIAVEIVPHVLEQSEKYDLPIYEIIIQEYTDTNEQYGRVPNTTISWSTKDGDIGSYINEKTNSHRSISLDRLSDTLGSLD